MKSWCELDGPAATVALLNKDSTILMLNYVHLDVLMGGDTVVARMFIKD